MALFGRRSFWFLVAFLALNQAVNFGLIQLGEPKNITQVTFTPIILGSMLAFGLSSSRARPLIVANTGRWWPYLVTLLMIVVAGYSSDMQGAPRLCFHILTTWLLAAILTRPESRLVRALEWRPPVFPGTVSYGIYLLHEIVLDRVERGLSLLGASNDWRFPVCMAATVLVAFVSYRLFESPFLRLKNWRLGQSVAPASLKQS